MSYSNINTQYRTGWLTFYTKVRPWISCFFGLVVIADFFMYTSTYMNNLWLLLEFACNIVKIILAIGVWQESKGDYVKFVHFVKGVLLFETFAFAYSRGVQAYISIGYSIGVAVIVFVVALVINYLVWYRLNMRYFEKRLPKKTGSYVTSSDKPQNINTVSYTNTGLENKKILFCRKCGERLLENNKYCHMCGAEIVKE